MIPPSADYDERLREEGIIMNKPQKQITLPELFKGEEINLGRLIHEMQAGVKKRSEMIADNIEPIIKVINENARQEMDPTYLYYMVDYALTMKMKEN